MNQPIEVWDPDTSPFVFLDRARPWLDDRRVAAVSGFGFGGTNFHAVLDDAAPVAAAVGRHHWPSELVALRAVDDADLAARLSALAERLAAARQDVAPTAGGCATSPPPSRPGGRRRRPCAWPSSPTTSTTSPPR